MKEETTQGESEAALVLRVEPGSGNAYVHSDNRESLVVGRSSAADLVVQDRYLSRRHLRIFREGGRFKVEDLGSNNGTRLNGDPVGEPRPLEPGDVIGLCGSLLRVLSIDGRERVESEETEQAILHSVVDLEARQESSRLRGGEALARYADRLRLLNEVHRALGGSLLQEDLVELILDRIFDHLGPEEVILFLYDDGELSPAARRALGEGGEEPTLCSRTLLREVTENRLAALVPDARVDDRFSDARSVLASGVRSILAAPLLHDEECLGVIALSSRAETRKFSEEDLELLVSLSSVAALYLQNLAYAEKMVEHRRLEKELELARQIQIALLPDRLPSVPGWEFRGGNLPSRGVSGDYYVVLARGDEVVIVVADVSGKGMAASLLTASLEALGAVPIREGRAPDEICEIVSEMLLERTPPEKYATAFMATIDTASGRLQYSNAGHNPALVVRASGELELLERTGLPLGLLEVAHYDLGTLDLEPGDTLAVYTDGITEASDPEHEEYGLTRLKEICRRHRDAALATLAGAIEEDIERFARGMPAGDDRTLVLARRL